MSRADRRRQQIEDQKSLDRAKRMENVRKNLGPRNPGVHILGQKEEWPEKRWHTLFLCANREGDLPDVNGWVDLDGLPPATVAITVREDKRIPEHLWGAIVTYNFRAVHKEAKLLVFIEDPNAAEPQQYHAIPDAEEPEIVSHDNIKWEVGEMDRDGRA